MLFQLKKKMKKNLIFFYDLLHLGPLPPPPLKKTVPMGPPVIVYIENREKIGFPMLTSDRQKRISDS